MGLLISAHYFFPKIHLPYSGESNSFPKEIGKEAWKPKGSRRKKETPAYNSLTIQPILELSHFFPAHQDVLVLSICQFDFETAV